jgi:CubicO group peptidase (beta-lactamase class C family)
MRHGGLYPSRRGEDAAPRDEESETRHSGAPKRLTRRRTDPGNAAPPPPGSPGEIKWDGATGVYLVVDRAQDMFFVLMENSPSGRMHVQVTLQKIIYDAFRN